MTQIVHEHAVTINSMETDMKPLTQLIDSTIAAGNEPDATGACAQKMYQSFLRRVLMADALATAMTGLFLALGAAPLSVWFGLPVVA